MISCFLQEVDENGTFLGYYPASRVNFLQTLRDNLSVPLQRPIKCKKQLIFGQVVCPYTSVRYYN